MYILTFCIYFFKVFVRDNALNTKILKRYYVSYFFLSLCIKSEGRGSPKNVGGFLLRCGPLKSSVASGKLVILGDVAGVEL